MDGYDIRALNLNHLRSKIGIVTQEPILFDTTIRENIAYGVIALQDEVSFDQIEQVARAANIHDFIMTLPDVSTRIWLNLVNNRNRFFVLLSPL